MKIVLTGGGTGGSVTPLIALYQSLKELDHNIEFLWIGQYDGVEKKIVEKYNIPYHGITAGKFRRYFSWQNFIDPFKIIKAYFQSKRVLKNFKADLVLTAGSFVAVPVAYASKSLKIPVLVHQQDVDLGLANKLMLRTAKFFNISLADLNYGLDNNKNLKILKFGNLIRKEILKNDKERIIKKLSLNRNLKTVLILGGGTGAYNLNKIIDENIEKLVEKYQIIHLTGKGKNLRDFASYYDNKYHLLEFLDAEDIASAFAFSDLVISRAGLSTLSELTALGKAVMIIPMPNSHQEDNAHYWTDRNAAYLFEEKNMDQFIVELEKLMSDKNRLDNLSKNIKTIMPADASDKLAKYLLSNI